MKIQNVYASFAPFLLFLSACLTGAAASGAITPYPVDSATLHLWHFDEGTTPISDLAPGGTNLNYAIGGAILVNLSYSNSPANFTNSISFGTLTTSNAVLFPAGSGSVGTAIPFRYAGPDGAFTYEAVVRVEFNPSSFVRSQPCQLINCDNNGTSGRIFQLRLNPVGYGGGDTNFVRIEFINGTTTIANAPIPTDGPDLIVSNSWYHVAVTYNGVANTTSNLLFYWTLLNPNRTAASCIYGTNMGSDLPGVSTATTIFSIGNSARNPGGGSGPATANFLGTIDEVRLSSVARGSNEFVFQNVSVLEAAGTQLPNVPEGTLDGNLATRWSAQGDGQYITYDLGRIELVESIDLAFYQPSGIRTNYFEVLLSNDNLAWHPALTGASGTNATLANFDFTDWPARYVRVVGHLNSQNDFNSLTETVIHYSVPADVDNDGLPDVWELFYFGNLNQTGTDDPNGDSQSNMDAFLHGTDPLTAVSQRVGTSPRVAFLSDSVLTTNACLMPNGSTYGRAINGISFQKQILLTFGGHQYTAWYDTVGTTQLIWLARRTVTNTSVGAWEKFQTDSEFLNGDESAWDAHDVIALGICPGDGTLHLAWDMHGQTLKYRRSVLGLCTTNQAAWGAGMLGAQTNKLAAGDPVNYDGSVTYPQFIATPDHKLMLDRRYQDSGNGDCLLQTYDPATGTWSTNKLYISRTGTYNGSTSRNAYLNGFDFGPDGKIHVTWTWREGAGSANHDICYAYSTDNGVTWHNNAGTVVADTSLGQSMNLNTAGIVIQPLNTQQLLINQQAQCVDKDGRLHVLMLHRRQESGYEYPNYTTANFSTLATAYYHYFRNPATGVWSQRRLPVDVYPVGSRPKIVYDANGNVYAAYLSYTSGTAVVPGYAAGKLVIASASRASDYTDWEVVQVNNAVFDGEPLMDQARLLADNLLSVYIQEHSATPTVIGTPLHVFDFAVKVTQPNPLSVNFSGADSLVVLNAVSGHTYQLQAATTLASADWTNVGPVVAGLNGLLALPDPNGRSASRRFYRVVTDP